MSLLRFACVSAVLLALSIDLASAVELQPFTATYDVLIDGKPQGRSTMRLEQTAPGQWRHTIEAKGTAGLARLSGFASSQVSHFDLVNNRPRLLDALARSEMLVRSREVRTTFDWQAGLARWDGDLKPDQRAPLALSDNAVNAAVLNLLLAFDSASAAPGARLDYRLFERGAADPVDYIVGTAETVTVAAGEFSAVRVRGERPAKQRVVTAWYAADLPPTPVRMTQVENGKPSYELRLAAVSR